MTSPTRSSFVSVAVCASVVWSLWLWGMVSGDRWHLFGDHWPMSVTMVVGSFVAGATSEGGGAVAFPVMTLVLGIDPTTARDFSLMIQSIGMSSAAVTILWTGIRVERRAILWASLGGLVGIVFGLEFVAHRIPPDFAKMLFTSTWLSFALALFWINRYHDREVHTEIHNMLPRLALLLFATGVVGGVISSITGSGLDIATFALLVLRLRIDEKVATPTSVVLMAINAVVGFAYSGTLGGGLTEEAWRSWWVAVPVVVVGAPVGARFIRNRSRHFVAAILYVAIVTQFVVGVFVVPQSPRIVGFSILVFTLGVLAFRWMANHGVRRLEWLAEQGHTRR